MDGLADGDAVGEAEGLAVGLVVGNALPIICKQHAAKSRELLRVRMLMSPQASLCGPWWPGTACLPVVGAWPLVACGGLGWALGLAVTRRSVSARHADSDVLEYHGDGYFFYP